MARHRGARLRAALNGRVITPDDAGYDEARSVFYGGIDRRPALIVRVADATDVSRVVGLARDGGLELAVRSGGHSGAGHSTTDGDRARPLTDEEPRDRHRRAHSFGPDRVDRGRVHHCGGSPRPRDGLWCHETFVCTNACWVIRREPGLWSGRLSCSKPRDRG
jgi:hypothetical protein